LFYFKIRYLIAILFDLTRNYRPAQMTNGENADAGITLSSAIRHLHKAAKFFWFFHSSLV
jgi:hypothetical protein